jgi:hypothetical protein
MEVRGLSKVSAQLLQTRTAESTAPACMHVCVRDNRRAAGPGALQDVALLAQACIWSLLDGVDDSDPDSDGGSSSSARTALHAAAAPSSAVCGGSGSGGPSGEAGGGGERRRRRRFNVVAVRDGAVPVAWRPDSPLVLTDLPAVQANAHSLSALTH